MNNMKPKMSKIKNKRLTMKNKVPKLGVQSKDIIDIISEDFRLDSSQWHGSDLLYLIKCQKRGRRGSTTVNNPNDLNIQQQKQKQQKSTSEKYIAIIRKKDSEQSIIISKVSLKDDELDYKLCCDLKHLKAIDFGSEENELLLTCDNIDHNFYFNSQTERDEVLWIIIQICKHALHNNELSMGYSIDVDSLSYIATTNNSLTRFPLLQKLIHAQTQLLGEFFSLEETEAESLLDELNWGATLQGHTDLQITLSKQSEAINHEIIDFLLQWEEMDDMGTITPTTSSAAILVNNNNNTTAISDKAYKLLGTRMSDTSEVLTALSSVDVELDAVSKWLSEQIGRLSEIQTNLSMIEKESGALESSWSSLSAVQDVVTLLVTRYSLSERHEHTLLNPDKIMSPIMKSTTVTNITQSINPLLQAMHAVRDALNPQFEDIADVSIAQWKQIQSMTAIFSQRAKLLALVDKCCSGLKDTALTIFEWLLKHKSLIDSGIIVKHFEFENIFQAIMKLKHSSFSSINHGSAASLPQWYSMIRTAETNPAINSREVFDSYLEPFWPLLYAYIDLAPSNFQSIRDSYVSAVTEFFYRPLFKQFGKDLLAITNTQHKVVTLANSHKAKIKGSDKIILPLSFKNGSFIQSDVKSLKTNTNNSMSSNKSNSGGNSNNNNGIVMSSLTTWHAFEIMLFTIMPLIEKEGKNIAVIFKYPGNESTPKSVYHAHFDKLRKMMFTIFDYIFSKLQVALNIKPSNTTTTDSITTTSSTTNITNITKNSVIKGQDGIEAIAMLTILTTFENAYRDAVIIRLSISLQSNSTTNDTTKTNNTTVNNKKNNNTTTNNNNMVGSGGAGGLKSNNITAIRSNSIANVRFEINDVIQNDINDNTTMILGPIEERALQIYSDMYIHHAIQNIKNILLNRISEYEVDQIIWIRNFKADPKVADVIQPVAAFHTFIAQVNEMCYGMNFEIIDDLFMNIAKELFAYITTFAKQNEKYIDKIKIVNYGYFLHTIKPRKINVLDSYIINATIQYEESTQRYLNWMVSYEFPALANLAIRLDSIGKRVNEEELSLYIRRKDILNVIKELEMKTLETKVIILKKRLQKHFESDFDEDLHLVQNTWIKIKDRIANILIRLEEAALLSYQIKLDVGSTIIRTIFDKFSDLPRTINYDDEDDNDNDEYIIN